MHGAVGRTLNSQPRGQRFKSRHGQGSFLPLIHENILEEDQECRTSPESESLQTKGRVSTNTQKFTIKPYKQLISQLTPRNSPLNPTKIPQTPGNSPLNPTKALKVSKKVCSDTVSKFVVKTAL